VLLVLASIHGAPENQPIFIASSTIAFISSICLCVVSLLHHRLSYRPSSTLCGFLLLTLLFDIVQVRTLWLSAAEAVEITFCRVFSASLALKVLLLILEVQHKGISNVDAESPEERAGIFELGSFIWLGPLFKAGNKRRLFIKDLFPLPEILSTEVAQSMLLKHLQSSDHPKSGPWLVSALARTLARSLILPVVPRIALTAFRFCQPFLIFSLLSHLGQYDAPENHGYGLIAAAIFVYTGIAVSTSFYWYFHEQTLCATRAALAGVIYTKTTQITLPAARDSVALTLMSTDVERIRYGLINLHEFWANMIEVAIASWLLYRQLGTAVAAPIVVVVCCIMGGAVTNRFTKRRQKAWMAKIQNRVKLTAEAISSMKQLKMSGLAPAMESLIQAMRVDELHSASRYRLVYVIVIGFGYAPTALCSVMTFAVTSRTLDVTTIFTSLSYLFLLSDPLGYIFQNTPHLIAAIACLERIQAFLAQDPQTDYRDDAGEAIRQAKAWSCSGEKGSEKHRATAATIKNGSFGWSLDTIVLRNVNITIPRSALTLIVGPVASGKSTLCRALVGAVPVAQGQVCIQASHKRAIGYCDQDPYLWNASIRENIVGFSAFDEKRYHEVLQATALLPDLASLPSGDSTKAWGSGSTLSGGQRQRVTLARALYAEAHLMICDDVLSGLDEQTSGQVFERTFGSDGIVRHRGATAVLCTNSTEWLPHADHIVVLRHGTVEAQGNLGQLSDSLLQAGSDGRAKLHDRTLLPATGERNTPMEPASSSTEQAMESYIDEDQRISGDSSAHRHYLRSLGIKSLLAVIFFGLGWGFFYNWSNIWLTFWAKDASSQYPSRSNGFYVGLYGLFQLAFLMSMVLCFLVCYRNGIASSGAQLHHGALKTVTRAPLSFFAKTDTGAVTSLFSQDMTLIDNELPVAFANLALDVCNALGMAVVIATASPYLAIGYLPILVILYFIQEFYLRTSRQLRLLDLEAKAPL
jgi:ABC-type multidrug transport system fused ATPase/permease subunit